MYNRYIPEDTSYTPLEEKTAFVPPFRLPNFLGEGKGGGLTALLKGLKLEKLDTGDILLLLIILYLLVEGDDLELVIALGLVLLMGLGEEK